MTGQVEQVDETAPAVAERCDVCGHPSAHHDRIALRYCAATQDNALSRACLCAATTT